MFWDVTPYIPVELNRFAGGTDCVQAAAKQGTSKKRAALLGLYLNPEDGSNTFLQHVRGLHAITTHAMVL
jgi:hypothetical protein